MPQLSISIIEDMWFHLQGWLDYKFILSYNIHIGCSFRFKLFSKLAFKTFRVDCEPTTDYRSRISCFNLTSFFALFVFLLCRGMNGAFTINSSTPTLRIHTFKWTPDISTTDIFQIIGTYVYLNMYWQFYARSQ
jgi:hypothetical protein